MSKAHYSLWDAIVAKNTATVKEILESGGKEARDICEREVHTVFSKNTKVRDGMNCLHLTGKKGNVNALVEIFNKTDGGPKKLNIEKKSSKLGWTPLHYAVYYGHATAAKTFLIKEAKINAITKDAKNALHLAVERGYRKMAALLVMKQIDINKADNRGLTALHYCVEENALENKNWTAQERVEMVEYLLMRGAEPERQDQDGNCALHFAVQNNVEEETILLLATALHQEGMLNVTNKDDKTPIDVCRNQATKRKLEELLRQEVNELTPLPTPESTPIHTPVHIEVTPPPSVPPPQPGTPEGPPPPPITPVITPHQASQPAQELPREEAVVVPLVPTRVVAPRRPPAPEKVKSPVSEPDVPDDTDTRRFNESPNYDITASDGPMQGPVESSLRRDKRSQGSASSLGGDGNTAMHLACKQYAINTGDVENGNTQIKGNLHYVQALLLQGGFNGGDINKRNKEGQTPLLISLKLGDLEMADFLVEHGANIHAMDLNGVTTKDLQPEWYHKKIQEANNPQPTAPSTNKRRRYVDESDTGLSSAKHTSAGKAPTAGDKGNDEIPSDPDNYDALLNNGPSALFTHNSYENILTNGPTDSFRRFTRENSNVKDERKPNRRPDSIMQDKKISYINHGKITERLAGTGNGYYYEALNVNDMVKVIGGVAGLYGPGLYVPRDMTSQYGSSSKTARQANVEPVLNSPHQTPRGALQIGDNSGVNNEKPQPPPAEKALGYITPREAGGSDVNKNTAPPDGLKRELTRLQEDVSEMKERLEELSGEGEGHPGDGDKHDSSPRQEKALQRQMTRLINDVSEVRQELERVSSEDVSGLTLV